jgi:hypothetical protein
MAARCSRGSRPGRVLLGVLAVAGCTGKSGPEPFTISIKVESDPGRPIAGASVSRDTRLLGTTGPDGRATLRLPGVEGEITDVVVVCPEGFLSPAKPVNLRLTRFQERTKIPEYGVQCPPAMRRVVVAVRAENGPHLPVLYLDKTVTRTDASGAASFALEVPPGSQFTVALSTAERKDIRPANPSKLFVVGAHDDVFLFDQKFDIDRRRPGAPAGPATAGGPRSL